MTPSSTPNACSEELVSALSSVEAYPHEPRDTAVVVHQTHISWVFLVGQHAYKIKKPIKTEFLDYSTLEKRERYCHEEVRLDRRYARELYLGVVPITRSDGRLRVEGDGPPVEFAVKMRRFPEDALLSDRLRTGKLSTDEVFQLAASVADFHRDAAKADPCRSWGSPEVVLREALDNLRHLQSGIIAADRELPLRRLSQWTSQYFDQHQLLFCQRVANGFIRECHGDLHLDNVIHWHGQLMPFDGIEFNDEFRLIDVMSDAAFLAMDFAARGHLDLGRSFINSYLDLTGDHASMPLLRWYLVYRALVRAKVASIRASQEAARGIDSGTAADDAAALADCFSHIDLADRFRLHPAPCLWITHGFSGSGKTTGSESVVQRRGAIRLRSDVERKRHFGIPLDRRPDARTRDKLYCPSANQATYGRLRRLAHGILQAGYSVVVDATFLQQRQRQSFQELADQLGVGFAILDFQIDQRVLRQRVADRMARDNDVSDADLQVLERQIAGGQPLSPEELRYVVPIPDTVAEVGAL